MDSLVEGLFDFFETLRARGFVLPLTFSGIAANGSIYTGRFKGEWEGGWEVETIHEPIAPLDLPLYLLFVDARGVAAGFIVAPQNTYCVQWPAIPSPVKGH